MPLQVRTLEAPPSRLVCPCCGSRVDAYLPIPPAYVEECRQRGVEHPLDQWETLNLENYLCPKCGATDRDRLQVLFLGGYLSLRRTELLSHQGRSHILEIAPSRPVSDWLRRQPKVLYRSADLEMASADDRVDVTDMACYPDQTFDMVICSHVLEHVPDDLQALREMHRVLKPTGVAILLVPISRLEETVDEDPTLQDEAERWRRFGQGDHIRIYGRAGFRARLEGAGFRLEEFRPERDFGSAGLAPQNCLYLGWK